MLNNWNERNEWKYGYDAARKAGVIEIERMKRTAKERGYKTLRGYLKYDLEYSKYFIRGFLYFISDI